MNRWLVREVVTEPDRRAIVSEVAGLVFVHPAVLEEIKTRR
jgi:hypothetical protein